MDSFEGTQFGNYRLIRLIERGELIDIYLAQQVYLGRDATIKVLHINASETNMEGFLSDMRAFVTLKHTHIALLLEFGLQDQVPFLALACVPERTLRSAVPPGRRLPTELACLYAYQVAFALHHAHERGLLHRDLRPEHLLLNRVGHLWVSDFGLARLMNTDRTPYIPVSRAPEAQHGTYSPASDQYSLAVLLYEWLTGHSPYQGNGQALLAQQLAGPPEHTPILAQPIEQVLHTALNPRPDRRYNSMDAFAQALRQSSGIGIQPELLAIHPQFDSPTTSAPPPQIHQPLRTGRTQLYISNLTATMAARPASDESRHRAEAGLPKPGALPPPIPGPAKRTPPVNILALIIGLLLSLMLIAGAGLFFLPGSPARVTPTQTPDRSLAPASPTLSPQLLYKQVQARRPSLVDPLNNASTSQWGRPIFNSSQNCMFAHGAFQVQGDVLINTVCMPQGSELSANLAFQADITSIAATDAQQKIEVAGLAFRSNVNATQYYGFSLDFLHKTFLITQTQNDIQITLQEGPLSSGLAPRNTLMLIAEGKRCNFYLNGVPIAFLSDPSPVSGYPGLTSFGSVATFSNAKVWQL